MADNKKWFKVWTSLLIDPDFDELHNQAVGVWLRLGALVASQGHSGKINISLKQLLKRIHMQGEIDKSVTEGVLKHLKKVNVFVTDIGNDTVTVEFKKWSKYQSFSESYERVQKFRNNQKCNAPVTAHKEEEEDKKKIRKEEDKKRHSRVIIETIIAFLNLSCNTHYRKNNKKTCALVTARLKEGFTEQDFQTVINNKAGDWLNKPDMIKFLRPETLFGNKFEGYLNQKTAINNKYAGISAFAKEMEEEIAKDRL